MHNNTPSLLGLLTSFFHVPFFVFTFVVTNHSRFFFLLSLFLLLGDELANDNHQQAFCMQATMHQTYYLFYTWLYIETEHEDRFVSLDRSTSSFSVFVDKKIRFMKMVLKLQKIVLVTNSLISLFYGYSQRNTIIYQ